MPAATATTELEASHCSTCGRWRVETWAGERLREEFEISG